MRDYPVTLLGVSSGRVYVRMPPALHEQLAAQAATQGVSLNQLVVTLLAGGIGFTLTDN
jgi:predicted HicB family RNase H-like nuclease